MPNRLSSLRDLRLSRKRAARNLRVREHLRYLVRRCRHQFSRGDRAAAATAVAAAIAAYDRAVRANIVKAGHAARHKSRLVARLNQLKR